MLTRNFTYLLGNTSTGMKLDNLPLSSTTEGKQTLEPTFDGIFSSTNWSLSKFIIGSGTNKPKNTDYILESEITEGYDCSTLVKRCVQGEEKDYINLYGVITNSSTSPITFTELGWIGLFGGNSKVTYLLAREVYDTPITIAPGESVAVNVNIM